MEQVGNLRLYSLDEVTDEVFGKVGTPERDKMEAQLNGELNAYYVGEVIKKARLAHNLTQEQLGEKIGVKKAQISKIERGYNITISTMSRVFKVLGINAKLDMGAFGEISI